jgi:cytochrome c-type biogenesis protein CcmH/NrfG
VVRIIAFLCLLLIAATPSPRHHHQTHEAKDAAQEEHPAASPISTQSYQSSPNPTPAETGSYTYYNNYPATKSESPPVWFQVLTTIALIFFTGALWVTSIWQWRAIKTQAEASKDSSGVASGL